MSRSFLFVLLPVHTSCHVLSCHVMALSFHFLLSLIHFLLSCNVTIILRPVIKNSFHHVISCNIILSHFHFISCHNQIISLRRYFIVLYSLITNSFPRVMPFSFHLLLSPIHFLLSCYIVSCPQFMSCNYYCVLPYHLFVSTRRVVSLLFHLLS